jgi:O-antigen ligase
MDRFAWLLGQGSLIDDSAQERETVARYGWELFLQAPFLGHGLGITFTGAQLSTHNLILRHLLEYGILGAFVFPTFLWASARSLPRDGLLRWRWLVGALMLFMSLFTHNMLEQAGFVLPWLALCLMGARPSAASVSAGDRAAGRLYSSAQASARRLLRSP